MRTLFPFLALLLLVASGCKDGLLEPERFGTIQGRILDNQTFAPIQGANVTTSPATNAILTGPDGSFTISEALVGNYTITANRDGYRLNTATVSVREARTTTADVLLAADDGTVDPATSFAAEILNFTNEPFRTDSSYVNVEYRALNNGTADIGTYEIYFRIETDRGPFFQEIRGTDLNAGQQDFGSFRKYLLGATATTVTVVGTNPSGADLRSDARDARRWAAR